MINNDILRRIRYTFDFSDPKMIALFALADSEVTKDQLIGWLKKEEDADFVALNDLQLATFLNGLINEKRGKREGEQPKPEKRLSNNIIFRKLKIALNMQADEIISILDSESLPISKHELSAFFRKAGHKHYRECKDQILRNFLNGVQKKYRPGSDQFKSDMPDNVWESNNATNSKD